jgi:lambda repressor-like predicted transcriptional regulator
MTEQLNNALKTDIISVIHRSGIGMRTQSIEESLSLPDDASLNTLLTELVTEGRLVRRATLLNNGDVSYLYDVPPAL